MPGDAAGKWPLLEVALVVRRMVVRAGAAVHRWRQPGSPGAVPPPAERAMEVVRRQVRAVLVDLRLPRPMAGARQAPAALLLVQ